MDENLNKRSTGGSYVINEDQSVEVAHRTRAPTEEEVQEVREVLVASAAKAPKAAKPAQPTKSEE